MNEIRRRRLILILLLLVAAGVAAALVTLALQQNLTYLHTPSEVHEGKVPMDSRFRLGGVVCEGSLRRTEGSLEALFDITDREGWYEVRHVGILPDLFREGQSVIATGRIVEGRFEADEVLAKHDETYMPREVEQAMRKPKAGAGVGCRQGAQAAPVSETPYGAAPAEADAEATPSTSES